MSGIVWVSFCLRGKGSRTNALPIRCSNEDKKGRLKPKIGFQTTFKLYLRTDSLHLLFRRVDGVLVGID